jgi:parallel beta-helix repeat protein
VVRGSTFEHATGALENGVLTNGSGIDAEPNPGNTVSTVLFYRCSFIGNAAPGLASGVPGANTGRAFTSGIFIDGNTFTGNLYQAIDVANCQGTVVINNTCAGNARYGILMHGHASGTICTGNTVTGTTGAPGNGIDEDTCSDDTITGNTATGNAGRGVYTVASTGSTVSGNTQSGNGIAP